ncbi:MAG: hypothetical protein HYV27_15325 [Candidatus Hydrogenedentes bacterium]|nr:hypothetical protein [Candidatus Hydrogenedentota bacterium]
MASVVFSVQKVGHWSWRLTPSSVAPGTPIYWYYDGAFQELSDRPFRQIDLAPGESMRVEGFTSGSDVPSAAYPGRLTVGWDVSAGATAFHVDRWTGAAWEAGQLQQAAGRSHLRWTSPVLSDETEHRYRIVPVGVNEGAGREIVVYLIRRPDAVAATFSYAGGELEAVF